MALQVDVYEDDRGVRPFDQWFDGLPIAHAAKVTIAVRRIGEGIPQISKLSAMEFLNGG